MLVKQSFLLGYLLMGIFLTSCGPTLYLDPGFQSIRKTQKSLAILPFKSSIEGGKLPKGMTKETLIESNMQTGYAVQSNVYSAFLKEVSKNKYDIEFQDIDKTNALLKKNSIAYADLIGMDKGELCKILNVDGVISGDIRMSKPMSETSAVVLAVLVGASGTTNKTDVALTIHDKKDSKLLWKYDYSASGSIGSSAESLTKGLMRNVSKNFPYKRKK